MNNHPLENIDHWLFWNNVGQLFKDVLSYRASMSEGKEPAGRKTRKPDFVRQIINFGCQIGPFLVSYASKCAISRNIEERLPRKWEEKGWRARKDDYEHDP